MKSVKKNVAKSLIIAGIVIAAILLIVVVNMLSTKASEEMGDRPAELEDENVQILADGILYSWKMENTSQEVRTNLLNVIEELNITTVYQDFSSEYLSEGDGTFIEDMNSFGVEILHLCGDPSWALLEKRERVLEEIDRVVDFNEKSTSKIAGIVYDVEPHGLDDSEDHDVEIYETYAENMEVAYEYAKKNDLYFVLAIPYWLNRKGDEILDAVIAASDEVSVMNYTTEKTIDYIKEEIQLAEEMDKSLNTIYELGFSKSHTFDNITEIQNDYTELYSHYGYPKLRIAYHHFGDLKE